MLTTTSEDRPQLLELSVLSEAHLLSVVLFDHLLELLHAFLSLRDLIRWLCLLDTRLCQMHLMNVMVRLVWARDEGIGLCVLFDLL